MRTVQLLLVFALAALLFGCQAILPALPGDATPEQAADRMIGKGVGEKLAHIIKPAPNGTLVVLRAVDAKPDQFGAGYALVTHENFGWHARQGTGMQGGIESDEPFSFMLSQPEDSPAISVFAGLVHVPDIQTVRATYADGKPISDAVLNGMFGIAQSPNLALCQVELQDGQGRVLYKYDLRFETEDGIFDKPEIKRAKKECQ